MAGQLRAIVYSRVSTDAQEREGTSLDTQEQACIDHIEACGWLELERIRDTASGFTLDRPGIARIRQLLRQGLADVVVAYAVDRLSRNQNHIGVLFDEVQQAGVRFDFVTEKFEEETGEAAPIEHSWMARRLATGRTWAIVYGTAAVLVVVIYLLA